MSKELDRAEVWEQVAQLYVVGVSQREIAECIGVDESRVSQIRAEEGYLAIEARVSTEKIQRAQSFNDAWENAEAKALNVINASLENNHDPLFALKVAQIANKAEKRGSRSLQGVINGSHNLRANIHMPVVFINELKQQNNVLNITQEAPKDREFKSVNMLNPGGVQKLLEGNEDNK